MPHTLLIVGAGTIGKVVTGFLAACGDYRLTVIDRDARALAALRADLDAASATRVQMRCMDAGDPNALRHVMRGHFAVVSAAPYHHTLAVAHAARDVGLHYLDLTEDVASTQQVMALAEGATTAFIPQCGLAPGFVSIAAMDMTTRFERLDSVRLRVGALPAYPSNALNYNLTWSTEGVINEYIEPCEAIVEGQRCRVQALEELESFGLGGVRYEAFNTSGGLGTLCNTLAGRVRTLNYRSIRYPGHAAIMRTLLHDLRLKDRRELLKDILEHALPATLQDVVIIFVTVTGWRDGRLQQESLARRIDNGVVAGQRRSAIQITTASSLCAMLDLLAQGVLPARGLVRQEQVPLEAFTGNRFGRVYAAPSSVAPPLPPLARQALFTDVAAMASSTCTTALESM
jgi:saccharopine dehydrogenase-like NADP-dependent oxidoreductase